MVGIGRSVYANACLEKLCRRRFFSNIEGVRRVLELRGVERRDNVVEIYDSECVEGRREALY
jgi:hypothetical protein